MIPNIVWSGGEEFRSKCVIGLERDGVINEWVDACGRPEDLKPINGSLPAMNSLKNKGYKLSIISDQRGVDQGKISQDNVDAVNTELMKLLGESGLSSIDGLYYSIGTLRQDPWVKPNTGMFKRCETENKGVKFSEGYYVGHTIKDLKAAMNIGAKPVLVRTGKGLETEKELNRYAYRELKKKVLIFDNLEAFEKSLD